MYSTVYIDDSFLLVARSLPVCVLLEFRESWHSFNSSSLCHEFFFFSFLISGFSVPNQTIWANYAMAQNPVALVNIKIAGIHGISSPLKWYPYIYIIINKYVYIYIYIHHHYWTKFSTGNHHFFSIAKNPKLFQKSLVYPRCIEKKLPTCFFLTCYIPIEILHQLIDGLSHDL